MNEHCTGHVVPAPKPAIRDGVGNVATHAVMAAFMAASGNADAWQAYIGASAYASTFGQTGKPGSGEVVFTVRAPDMASGVALELDGIELDVLRWLDARFAANGLAGQSGVRIAVTASDFYRDRGTLTRGGGGVTSAHRTAFDAAIDRLARVRVSGYTRIRGERQERGPAPIVHATFEGVQTVISPDGQSLPRGGDVALIATERLERGHAIAFGGWYEAMHNAFPRQRINTRVFSLHDRGDQLARRIGAYLEAQAFIRRNPDTVGLYVDTVLKGAGVVPKAGERPSRFRKRVERALDALQHAGLIAGWSYRDGEPYTAAWRDALLSVQVRDVETGKDVTPEGVGNGENA